MHDPFQKPGAASPPDPLREALLAHTRRLGVLAVRSGVGAAAIDSFISGSVQLGPDARRALEVALADPNLGRRPEAQEAARQGRAPRGRV